MTPSEKASSLSGAKRHAAARLIDAMATPALWIDPQLRTRSWNAAMGRLAGAAEPQDAPLDAVLHRLLSNSVDCDLVLDAAGRLAAGNGAKSARLPAMAVSAADGAALHMEFELSAVAIEEGGGALALLHDATALVNARRDMDLLLRNTSDGIFVIAKNGQITVFNDACERITGYKREEVLYQAGVCRKVFPCRRNSDSNLSPMICPGYDLFVEHKEILPREQRIRTRDGRMRWVECSYSPIYSPDGAPLYFIGILRDIAERKRMEERERLMERLSTLSELVGGLAHEIRNPLGIIRSAVDIVANEERPSAQRQEAALFIRDEAERLNRTVQALLNFVRPKQGSGDPIDIGRLIERVVSYYAPERREFRIMTRIEPDLPAVRCCSDAFQSVVLNLILNADQAMDQGGTLTIEARRLGGGLQLVFRDDGPGIDPEKLETIFEPFVTTKKQGTGLGLSIVAHIVKAHQGTIRAENNPEGGARFIVELPDCFVESSDETDCDR